MIKINSFVLIKVPKTGSETLKDYLYQVFINKKWKKSEILDVPYDNIMKETQEKKICYLYKSYKL